nr:hypothetical protein [Tanacetum cinerariifolium]
MMLCLLDGGAELHYGHHHLLLLFHRSLLLPIYPHHLLLLHHRLSFHLHLLLPHPRFIDDELFLSGPRRTFPLVDFTILILRFRDSISSEDSVEEDIYTDLLEDIEADATVAEVEAEVESSDSGTMEVGLDVVSGIDIPDGMLMHDAVERLEQVVEGLQDIYEHVMEIPLQRIEDIKTGQRELEARSTIDGGDIASCVLGEEQRETSRHHNDGESEIR